MWGCEGCRVNRLGAERHPEEIYQQREWCRAVKLWIWVLHVDRIPSQIQAACLRKPASLCWHLVCACVCVVRGGPHDTQSETYNVERGLWAAITLSLCHPFCQNPEAWVYLSLNKQHKSGIHHESIIVTSFGDLVRLFPVLFCRLYPQVSCFTSYFLTSHFVGLSVFPVSILSPLVSSLSFSVAFCFVLKLLFSYSSVSPTFVGIVLVACLFSCLQFGFWIFGPRLCY